MAIVKVPSPKGLEIVESLLLDLLDPENKGYALFESPKIVAANPETRTPFLEAAIPLYLFLFLNTTSEAKSFEHLRVTSLGVLSALAKVDDTEVVKFLLRSEVISLCLRIMGTGSELSKTGLYCAAIPEALRNGTFDNFLREDPAARNFLQQLLDNLAGPAGRSPHPSPGPAEGAAPHPGSGPSACGSHGGPSQPGPSRTP